MNHCIDDIESLVMRTKKSAEAWRKLQKKKGKAKRKSTVDKTFPIGGGMRGSACQSTQKTHKSNGQNSGGREALNSRGKGTRRISPPGGRQDRVVPVVATLDRSPDQSPGGEAHILQY